jgi:hypothetical protein
VGQGKEVRNEVQHRSLRWLNVGRWWICGTGLFVLAPVVLETLRNYRKWHAALASDVSAANFWRTAFYLDIARFIAEIGLIVAIFFVLKPRPNMFGFPADQESRELRHRGK